MLAQRPVRVFWYLSLFVTLLLFALFRPLHAPLENAAAPAGIINYELARTEQRAAEMLASWSPEEQLRAAFGLGLDYLFMVSYAAAIGLACAQIASSGRGWPARLGKQLAWALVAAALLDAVENVALWQQLLNGADGTSALLAWLCATIKFALLAAGLLYVLAGALFLRKGGRR
jgi:hypothetical protein